MFIESGYLVNTTVKSINYENQNTQNDIADLEQHVEYIRKLLYELREKDPEAQFVV